MEGSSSTGKLDNASYLHVEDTQKWTNKENQILENLEEENKARLRKEGKAVTYENSYVWKCAGSSSQRKEKTLRWTQEEHKAFLVGLEVYGKGNWSSISKVYVPTKTTSQVASHAQKYFRRVQSKTPSQKRRCSIHDTRILGSGAIVHISPRLITADSAALNATWQEGLPSNSARYHSIEASSIYSRMCPEDQQHDGSTPFNHFSASHTQEQEQEQEDPDFLYMLKPFSP